MTFNNIQPSLVITDTIILEGVYPDTYSGTYEGGDPITTLGYGMMFACNFAPRGYADTSGQLLSIAQNTALFSILGTTYGGNGVTTFGLPNLQNGLLIGDGFDDFGNLWSLGQTAGSNTGTVDTVNLPTPLGGGGSPVDTMQASLTGTYLINVEGVYPATDGYLYDDSIGVVHRYYGAQTPDGTMECDGRALSIADFPALFTVIGTTYGGDGVTTFNLPDLRGRTIVGDSATTYVGEELGSLEATIGMNNTGPALGGADLPINNVQPSLVMNMLIATQGIFPSRSQRDIDNKFHADEPGGPSYSNGGDGDPFLSQIFFFAGANPSFRNAAVCNGQLLSIQQNTALFSLLGVNFGGNGVTTFALPDFQGRTPMGSSPDYPVGTQLGSETVDPNVDDVAARTQYGSVWGDYLVGGSGADSFLGGDGNDYLVGNGGADYLTGQAGDDTLVGGTGDDVYRVDSAADVISEGAAAGSDKVQSVAASYTLAANVENMRIVAQGLDGTGNDLANEIMGNGNANVIAGEAGDDMLLGMGGTDTLTGGDGIDTINGGGGRDTIDGGAGDDVLQGGLGVDVLTGSAGADRFVFADADCNANGVLRDEITDFSQSDGDIIDLSGLDGDTTVAGQDPLSFIGQAAFTGQAGEVRFSHILGNTLTSVQVDTDGDGASDVTIRIEGPVDLVAANFIFAM